MVINTEPQHTPSNTCYSATVVETKRKARDQRGPENQRIRGRTQGEYELLISTAALRATVIFVSIQVRTFGSVLDVVLVLLDQGMNVVQGIRTILMFMPFNININVNIVFFCVAEI